MALRNQPYIPLYVEDFLTDEKLNLCSAATQGIYIKMMCIFHKSENYGGILLKQKDKQNSSTPFNFACKFAKLLPFSFDEILLAITELIDENVLLIDGDFLFQKRMVKDNYISETRSESGKKGGLSAQKNKEKTVKNDNNFAKAKVKAKSKQNTEYEYKDNNIDINSNNSINDNIEKKEKEKKENFAEFVTLTKTEYNKLVEKYGEVEAVWMIDKLNNYKGSKNKKYNSDYMAILNWVVGELAKEKEKYKTGRSFFDNLNDARNILNENTKQIKI